MSRKIIVTVAILCLIIIGGIIFLMVPKKSPPTNFSECEKQGYPVMESYPRRCAAPGGPTFTEEIEEIVTPLVTSPKFGASLSGDISVEGTAPGAWFFEGSFPVLIEDPSGNILSEGFVTAQSDWMTTLPIIFRGTLKGPGNYSGKAVLVLKKDNPSGLPENDARYEIPVNVTASEIPLDIPFFVFFGKYGPDSSMAACENVFAVERRSPKTLSAGKNAIEELLKGPTAEEEKSGYFTSLNDGVKLKSISIENGVARVDFDPELEKAVGGSCRVSAIRTQITRTLLQFPSVKSVIISIDGRTEDILQP